MNTPPTVTGGGGTRRTEWIGGGRDVVLLDSARLLLRRNDTAELQPEDQQGTADVRTGERRIAVRQLIGE
jgi:hypothetical protein